jgi:Na+/serine symporter
MIKDEKYFPGIRGIAFIVRFLLIHESAYKQKLCNRVKKIGLPLFALAVGILSFPLERLSPTGELTNLTQYRIRLLCMIILAMVFLTSLILLTIPYVKKWRNPSKLTSQELKRLINSQTSQQPHRPDRE